MTIQQKIKRVRTIARQAYTYLHCTGDGWTERKASGVKMERFMYEWEDLMEEIRPTKEWADYCEANGIWKEHNFGDVLA